MTDLSRIRLSGADSRLTRAVLQSPRLAAMSLSVAPRSRRGRASRTPARRLAAGTPAAPAPRSRPPTRPPAMATATPPASLRRPWAVPRPSAGRLGDDRHLRDRDLRGLRRSGRR